MIENIYLYPGLHIRHKIIFLEMAHSWQDKSLCYVWDKFWYKALVKFVLAILKRLFLKKNTFGPKAHILRQVCKPKYSTFYLFFICYCMEWMTTYLIQKVSHIEKKGYQAIEIKKNFFLLLDSPSKKKWHLLKLEF